MACSCSAPEPKSPAPGFRRALWIALWVNLAMFVVEGIASLSSGSVSLMADAIDFFGDSANYILSLTVLSMGMLWRGRAAMVKGITMTVFGLVVWARAVWVVQAGITPEPLTMGAVGLLALTANVSVAAILFKFREGIPTCVRSGCAAGTMPSATSPLWWPHSVCSVPELPGPT